MDKKHTLYLMSDTVSAFRHHWESWQMFLKIWGAYHTSTEGTQLCVPALFKGIKVHSHLPEVGILTE